MSKILAYVKTSNTSLRTIYEDFQEQLFLMPHSNFKAVEVFKNLSSLHNVSDGDGLNIDYSLDRRDFEGEWRYVGFLLDLKLSLWNAKIKGKSYFEWETDQVGTFFIKALNKIGDVLGSYDYPDECLDGAIDSIKKLFKLPLHPP